MSYKYVKIIHKKSNQVIADGPLGWGITPFENNFYILRRYLKTDSFRINYFPGICIYKFLYVWLDFVEPDGTVTKNLGWKYWLPNPLLPFIWLRIAVPRGHPNIRIERYGSDTV